MAQTYGPCGEITVQTAGGILKPVAFTSGQIAASTAAGDLLSVTAGAGQYLSITHILANGTTNQDNMTLTVDGVDLFSDLTLSESTNLAAAAAGTVWGVLRAADTVSGQARLLQPIYCNSFTLTKEGGVATAYPIDWAYETLEAL